jgi:hypothetical protein
MLNSGSEAMRLLNPTASQHAALNLPLSINRALEETVKLSGGRIDSRHLWRQVLLQLHRFHPSELEQSRLIEDEVTRQAERLALKVRELPAPIREPKTLHLELQRTQLRLVDASIAELIHRTHHYLGSFRGDALHLGIYADEAGSPTPTLLSLVSLSPFDLTHLADALPPSVQQEQVLVLSRLFAFDWCPRNTVSYTLGRVFKWLRERLPHVKMLLTYLNPNLGFSGSVYQATNWKLFGRENKRRYLYLDSHYVTDRQVIRAYGTADLQQLRTQLGARITGSVLPLKPLEVYVYFLDDALRRQNDGGFAHEFQPSRALVGG